MQIIELARKAGDILDLKPDQEQYLTDCLDRSALKGPLRTFIVVRDGSTGSGMRKAPPHSNVIQGTNAHYVDACKTFKNFRDYKPILAYVGDERVLVLASYQSTPQEDLEYKRNLLALMSEGKIPSNEADRQKLIDQINPPKKRLVTFCVEIVAELPENVDPDLITFKGIEMAVPQAMGRTVGRVTEYQTTDHFDPQPVPEKET